MSLIKKAFIPALMMLTLCTSITPTMAGEINLAATGRPAADLERDAGDKPLDIIHFAGIKDGMVVGDVFGGGGYYSELLGQAVGPKGKVYLHNNQAYMPFVGKDLEARLANNRLKNVERYDREAQDLSFPDASLDAVFLVMSYHDFFFKDEGWDVPADKVMSAINKALKPGGILLVVDHAAVDGSKTDNAKSLHRIDAAFAKNDITKRGFTFVKDSQMLRHPEDDRKLVVFDPKIRRKTDRFVYLFKKA